MAIGNDFLDFYLQLLNIKNIQTTILKDIQTQLQNQNSSQTSSQGQTQNDVDNISNVGNPVVNINISSSSSTNNNSPQNLSIVRPSAFRATNNIDQPLTPLTRTKVLYQNEQFDLDNEYNPTTSTFIPKINGVYALNAAISFSSNNDAVNNIVSLELHVNGTIIAIDNDFFGPVPGAGPTNNGISVTTIIQLQAGDRVEVFAQSSQAGNITFNDAILNSTHFEAGRLPSPSV